MLQPWDGEDGAKKKDRLERRLQHLVCSKLLGLRDAQAVIWTDWQAAYQPSKAPKRASLSTSALRLTSFDQAATAAPLLFTPSMTLACASFASFALVLALGLRAVRLNSSSNLPAAEALAIISKNSQASVADTLS